MIKLTLIDLRHYERKQDTLQSSTPYGNVSTVAAAYLLQQRGLVPQYCITSPQPRAISTSKMITWTLSLNVPSVVVPTLDDLSSDPSFEIARLKAEAKEAGVTPEFRALTADWTRQYLFDRTTRAFEQMGDLFHKHLSDGMTVLSTSHGAAVEMRCLRMMTANSGGGTLVFDQNVSSIAALAALHGGCFDTSEGAIHHDLVVEGNGHIVNCGEVELFRLPAEVKALKPILNA